MSWPIVKLGEIFDITSSKRVHEIDWRNEGVPFYRAREVAVLAKEGRVDNDLFIDESMYEEFKAKYGVPKVGDLLVTAVGTLGRVYAVQESDRFYFKDASVIWLRARQEVDTSYIQHAMNSTDVQRFIQNSSGATVGTYTISRANETEIPLPPLPEQKRIAAILDKSDAIRRKRQQAIQLADDFLRAVFLDMFGDPVTNPKGWEITSLTSCGSFKNGLNFDKGEVGNSLRYLGVGDFKSLSTIVDMLSLGSIDLNKFPGKDYLLEDGDLVFVRSNGNKALVGRCVTVYPGGEALTFSGFCIRYRVEGGNAEPEYLNYLFRTPSMKQVMLSGGQGANIQNINQKLLSSLEIPLPPVEHQRRFSKIVAAYRQSMLLFDSSIADVENMFEVISQKAFSGQL